MSRRTWLAITMSLLLVAACSGSGATSQTAATAGAVATTNAPSGTEAASVTQEPVATGQPAGTGGGGAGGDACALLTTDEVATATGQANVTAGSIPLTNLTDALGGCAYVGVGTIPIMNLVFLDSQNASSNPDDMKLLPLTEEVHVNGARAMWVPAAGSLLFVYKSNKVVMVQVLLPLNNDIKATAVSVAQKIADRM